MNEQVRAKFRVQSRKETDYGSFVIETTPVYANDPEFGYENDRYSKATPGGKLEMLTVNAAIAPLFKPGVTFYMGFDFDTPEARAAAAKASE
jgi:hypothetical protein